MKTKNTKIVASISDLNCEVDFLKELYENGMNVARINTAHVTYESAKKVINNVRTVSSNIAILLDTKGPEMRTTASDDSIKVSTGDKIFITGNKELKTTQELVSVNYNGFVNDVPVGSRILIDDGELALKVVGKNNEKLECEAENEGYIVGKKSVNVPSVNIKLSALSDKDREFILYAIENNLDFIAHSFVRSKEDIIEIQKILDENNSSIKIIAKIENQEGVDNIEDILDHAYGIMIARGDLAVEIPRAKIPFIQKNIIKKCIARRKPVIIATQMLHSMIKNPRPTRAEVSDVANAIYDGTDAVMLSGETAYGKYPVEAVKTMSQIALECEANRDPFLGISSAVLTNKISAYLCKKAVKASTRVDANAIIADTWSGTTMRNVSGYRGKKSVYALCYKEDVMRLLSLSYGIHPFSLPMQRNEGCFLNVGLNKLIKKGALKPEDTVVVLAGNFGLNQGASYVEISTVNNILKKETFE